MIPYEKTLRSFYEREGATISAGKEKKIEISEYYGGIEGGHLAILIAPISGVLSNSPASTPMGAIILVQTHESSI